jgi:hypothetical protein
VSFFRKPFLPFLMLLLMMSSASVELCAHGHHGSAASSGMETSLASACEGCDGEGHEDSHHELCDSCLCTCHGAGILVAGLSGNREAAHGATQPSEAATRLPGHLSGLERPPLRS